MSDLELTELYRELQRVGHGVAQTSPLITNCESELSELIRQIDIMFKSKKNEWQREKATFELKVDTKAREVQLQQDSIDRKNQEIARLREQTLQAEREDKKLISDYQFQVEQLHKDLTVLKKQYEKMRTKHQKEKVKLTAEKHELETSHMANDKKQLQYEVDRLLNTVKALTEKCDLMEQQGSSYQDQLAKRKQMIGDIEVNLRSELAAVRSQLREAEDRESERNVEVARLKADFNHWKNRSTKLSKELQSTDESLKKANSLVKSLQAQNDSLTSELKTQGSSLHLATKGQHCQEKEVVKLRDMIIEKDKTIRSLLDKQHLDESTALEVLKNDLLKVDDENRDLKAKEVECRSEITKLQSEYSTLTKRLNNTDQQCLGLREQLHDKEKELRETEDRVLRDRDSSLNELQTKIFSMKSDHDEEIVELKKELQACRAQLCEAVSRNNQTCLMTTFSEGDDSHVDAVTAAMNENQTAADLRLTTNQLQALRLENQHLKEQVLTSQQTGADVRQAQKHLSDIQSTYDGTVERLQGDNRKLRTDLDRLREDMMQSDDSHHHKYRKLLKDMQDDIERRESRLLEEHTLNHSRLQESHDTHDDIREAIYQQEMTSLRAQKSMLMERLDETQSEIAQCMEEKHVLAHENQLMSSFADNISGVMASSSKREINHSHYNSAFDDQTTDFMLLGNSPDPVRRMIGDETTLDNTLQDSDAGHSSPSRSARSRISHKSGEHHNSTSTPKKNSINKSPYGHSLSKSGHSHSQSSSKHHSSSKSPRTQNSTKSPLAERSSSSPQGQRSTTPHSRRSKSNRSSPTDAKGSRRSSPRSHERSCSPVSGRSVATSGRLSSIHGNDYNDSLNTSSTGSMVAEKFLRDQRQRTAALEQMLDQHIQGLREDSKQLMSENDGYLHSF